MCRKVHRIFCIFTVLILICSIFAGCTQEKPTVVKETSTNSATASLGNLKESDISADNIMDIIKELTSEKYRGRLAGSKENQAAAEYIAAYFKDIGLENPKNLTNYMQEYTQATVALKDKPVLQVLDKKGKVKQDFNYPENFVLRRLSSETSSVDLNAPMYLVEDSSILRKNDGSLKGKILLIPWALYDLLGSQNEPQDFAKECGALGIISEFNLENNDLGYRYLKVRPLAGSWMRSDSYMPFAFVDSNTFATLAKTAKQAAKQGDKLHFGCSSEVNLNDTAANVIGLIPGSDSAQKDHYIIISAHFDHVGDNMNGTYNPGALDNASGVSVMMELARVIKESKIQPKRPILFIAFNGEEGGLRGARYYSEYPVYPLEKSVLINVDMVGSAADIPLTIATASASSVKSLRDSLAVYADKLGITYVKDIENASDHAAFDPLHIPAVSLLNLDLSSGYHSPHDTIETVSKDKIKEIARLILLYLNDNAY